MNWRTRRASVARGHQSPFTVSMLALFIDSMAGGVGWVGSLLLATRQRCCGVIPAKNHEPPFSLKNMIDTTQYVMTQTKKTPDGIAKAKKLYWIDCLSFAAVAKIIFGNRNAQMRIRRWIGPGERNRRGSNANKQKNESIKRHAKKLILVEGLSFRKVARRLGVCPETVSFLIGRPFPSRVKKETLSTLNAKRSWRLYLTHKIMNLTPDEFKRAVAWAKAHGLVSMRPAEPIARVAKNRPWGKRRKTLAERLAESPKHGNTP